MQRPEGDGVLQLIAAAEAHAAPMKDNLQSIAAQGSDAIWGRKRKEPTAADAVPAPLAKKLMSKPALAPAAKTGVVEQLAADVKQLQKQQGMMLTVLEKLHESLRTAMPPPPPPPPKSVPSKPSKVPKGTASPAAQHAQHAQPPLAFIMASNFEQRGPIVNLQPADTETTPNASCCIAATPQIYILQCASETINVLRLGAHTFRLVTEKRAQITDTIRNDVPNWEVPFTQKQVLFRNFFVPPIASKHSMILVKAPPYQRLQIRCMRILQNGVHRDVLFMLREGLVGRLVPETDTGVTRFIDVLAPKLQ